MLGFGLISFKNGEVLIITGTVNFKLLKEEFKLVRSILDSLSLWLLGKIGNDDFLFDPQIGI